MNAAKEQWYLEQRRKIGRDTTITLIVALIGFALGLTSMILSMLCALQG